MKRRCLFASFTAAVLVLAISPAEAGHAFDRLLPASTLGALMVPDGAEMRTFWEASSLGMLARDPEMEPFLAKVGGFWNDEIARPFAEKTGFELSELGSLLRHAFAVALVAPESPGDEPVLLAVLAPGEAEVGDVTDLLVGMARSAPGARVSVETFRGIDLQRIEFEATPSGDAGDDPLADDAGMGTGGPRMRQMFIASVEGMCVVTAGGDGRALAEGVVAAIETGSATRSLADTPAYEAAVRPLETSGAFRFYMAPAAFVTMVAAEESPQVQLVLDAIGLKNLEGFLAEAGRTDVAEWGVLHLYAPKGKRGILKLMDLEDVPTDPPPFVGADVASYSVYGLDISKLYTELLSVVETIQPEAVNMVNSILLTAAGQASEPVDIQKEIIQAFGPGIMSVSSYPKPYAPDNERAVMMLGSRNPEGMIRALRTLLRPSAESPSMLEEREYMGRSVYRVEMPIPPVVREGQEAPETPEICMTALPGWLVVAGDSESLEAMIRSLEGAEEPLALSDGYRQALGMLPSPQGYLEYTNLRTAVEYLVTLGSKAEEILSPLPADARFPLPSGKGEMDVRDLIGWLDLLPAPERVARYFGVTVTAGETTPDGTLFRSMSPRPAGL